MPSSSPQQQQPDAYLPPDGDATTPGGPDEAPGGTGGLRPGQGWAPGSDRTDRSRTRSAARLPWVIVAMLATLSLVLGSLLVAQNGELQDLRRMAEQAPAPAATAAQQAPQQTQATPAPEAVAAMKKLPRRVKDDPTALGKVDAPVTMIVWSDYRCPFCSVWARDTFPQLKPYVDSGSLRIEHRDLVLFGEQSMATAIAARAAGQQGKYWEFSHAVHAAAPTSGHPEITAADLKVFAQQAGVPDLVKFSADSTSAGLKASVEKDVTEARQLGLTGTPFFVINTTPLSGAQPLRVFTQTLEANGAHK
ncbi:hypothetical protein GCM10027030_18760 [Luteococcus sediminum]